MFFEFPDVEKFVLDVTKIYEFEDLPPVFRRHITYRASRMAATQLVANPQLVQLLQVVLQAQEQHYLITNLILSQTYKSY